jgi:hypothetical protein
VTIPGAKAVPGQRRKRVLDQGDYVTRELGLDPVRTDEKLLELMLRLGIWRSPRGDDAGSDARKFVPVPDSGRANVDQDLSGRDRSRLVVGEDAPAHRSR